MVTTAASDAISAGASPISAAPWQRVDAAWPVWPDAATGLDAEAQRLLRLYLTTAVAQRLRNRHHLEEANLWMWQPLPGLAEYVRQRRFLVACLHRYPSPEMGRLLRKEASLTVEVLATPPSYFGIDLWAALLALQCQRIGQLYAHLRERAGQGLALEVLQRALQGLLRGTGK
jgi:hypothetical protein